VALAARPMVGRGPIARLGALATLARSSAAARRLVRERGIDVAVGTGGYASVPAALGAAWARRPLVLVEPNAVAGSANRWLSRVATSAAVAYEGVGRRLACRSFVSGVPVREEFFAVPPLSADAPPRLLVLGGSQGARRVNVLLPAAVERVRRTVRGLTVVHQCGERHVAEARALWQAVGLAAPDVEVVPFLSDVAAEMSRATLVLSRAGAITLAEIAAAGRAAVLAPLALAGAHQRDNARRFEAAGAARVIDEAGTTPESLGELLAPLLADGPALAEAGGRARGLARPGAAVAIADEVESVARAGR
jgi:UDP-N-acetylglucosamine--N-acetylmuramyl-(pentapeptide) pyrophosphoryl-undecaprenol N-acetylglucosamine transferase